MSAASPLTIEEAAVALRAGTVTSTALTREVLDRVARLDGELGAYVTVCADEALAAAAEADADFARGRDRSPLQGVPLAVKDIIATRDAPTRANSEVIDPGWGGGADAPVVARLRAAGSVLLGKTTTNEFACGLPDRSTRFPFPRNPWNPAHTPMGSSSGTAIAVSAGLALGGLGTDTGGSVRGPAGANGHTGLKVTFGRVPKNGVVPCAFSLDTVGPMARSAYDCALILGVIAGHDPGDRYSSPLAPSRYAEEARGGGVEGLRIGVPTGYFLDSPLLDAEVRAGVLRAAGELARAGATLTDVVVPHAQEANDANNITFLSEAFAFHRENLTGRWAEYGRSTRELLARAAFLTGADYVQAQRVRGLFRRGLAQVFERVDVLVTPVALTPPAPVETADLTAALLRPGFHGPWNAAGLPAAAVPCGFTATGLPLSFQVVGRPFGESTVLRVADTYQRHTDWHRRVPPAARDGIPHFGDATVTPRERAG
ncbi:amidase [Spongiactinospora sp. TRM90649]|uniref:amidase n=1 Tax=Spongiactinospora sp. TRM90649 TaxID=3031114 RepID=UPI0023F715D0|nr:amidase [Spongiactinospora sp. TRM90649]MDF5757730.1 amidase [Spongiactinospora sp. TRM90649]